MSKQEVKLASVKKSCHMAKKVSRAIAWVMSAAGAICLAGSGIVLALREQVNSTLAAQAENITISNPQINGLLSLHINLEAMVAEGNYAQAFMVACLFGAVVCFVVAAILFMITKALVKLEESQSPFDASVLGLLKKVFISITVVIAVLTGLGIGVVIGLSLWCVYCIMDYGCALQEEVDETI